MLDQVIIEKSFHKKSTKPTIKFPPDILRICKEKIEVILNFRRKKKVGQSYVYHCVASPLILTDWLLDFQKGIQVVKQSWLFPAVVLLKALDYRHL